MKRSLALVVAAAICIAAMATAAQQPASDALVGQGTRIALRAVSSDKWVRAPLGRTGNPNGLKADAKAIGSWELFDVYVWQDGVSVPAPAEIPGVTRPIQASDFGGADIPGLTRRIRASDVDDLSTSAAPPAATRITDLDGVFGHGDLVRYAAPGDFAALERVFGFGVDAGWQRDYRNGNRTWRQVIERQQERSR